MTIKTCKALIYTYEIENDHIFFIFKANGINYRSCRSDEIRFFRAKIDSIFYFYILQELMLFLPGNGLFPIKFSREQGSVGRPINGIWTLTDGVLFRQVTDQAVIMNGL